MLREEGLLPRSFPQDEGLPAPRRRSALAGARRGCAMATRGEVLLEEAEKAAPSAGQQPYGQALDGQQACALFRALEKKAAKNTSARVSHPDSPLEFVNSEVDLDDAIRSARSVASEPSLLPSLPASSHDTLLSLLEHPNTDISLSAIELISELLDTGDEPSRESVASAASFTSSLVSSGLVQSVSSLIQRMRSPSHEDDAQTHKQEDDDEGVPQKCVRLALSVLESAVELSQDASGEISKKSSLVTVLLALLKNDSMDQNQLQASEVLSAVLSSSAECAEQLGSLGCVEALLSAALNFDTDTALGDEEEELAANVFNCLCSSCLADENKNRLTDAGGIEIAISIVRVRGRAAPHALKLLDFVLTRCVPACERFVDSLGLKTAFAALMGKLAKQHTRKRKRKERDEIVEEEEQRGISIIASLCTCIVDDERRNRLLGKFAENDYQKTDKVFDIFCTYHSRVIDAERSLDTSLDSETAYLERLEAGLGTAQNAALVLAHVWATEDEGALARIRQLLKLRKLTFKQVRGVLLELAESIGDAGGSDVQAKRKQRLMKLAFGLKQDGEHVTEESSECLANQPDNNNNSEKLQSKYE